MPHTDTFHRVLCFFLLLLFACLGVLSGSTSRAMAAGSSAAVDPDSLTFQLVSENTGWVRMGEGLYRTEDNGLTWQEMTPPLSGAPILDVFFLDGQNGWAMAGPNGSTPFVLASTSDGGQSWNLANYDFPEVGQSPAAVAGVHMQWRDPLNGWLVFKLATSSNFSAGLLYTTQDGGGTWSAHEIPLGEPAYFVDARNGWVAGGPADRLFRTQDGGQSWQEQTPAPNAYYQLPVFVDGTKAILPAIGVEQDAPQAEFFRTEDAGQTWTSAGRVLLEPDTPSDSSLPFSVSEAGAGTLIVPGSDRIVRLTDDQLTESKNEDGLSAGLAALEMASPQSGWGQWTTGTCDTAGKVAESLSCTRETRLLRTSDGGLHWEPILLPAGQASIQESFSLSGKTDDRSARTTSAIADPDTQPYIGQGFDKCEVPTITQLQKWWTSSPYNAVNLYMGGSARGCSNAALSASFLSQASAQGWRFIPTWVGPQASCTGYSSRMSSNDVTAYSQGVAQADAAADTAVDLGISEANGSGTIIYYDLEAYDTSNATCRNAANAFISGWVAEMRARGNLGGVYGASCASAVTDWASLANVPDALWIANWYGNSGTVSYRPTASVWNAACLSNSLWANHERLRQYAGGHSETWGGITLNIDSNVIDGPLTASNGTAGQSAPGQPLDLGPLPGSTLERTADTWLSWKTTGDTCTVHIWGGAIDTTASGSCSFYHLGVKPGGSYSWQVTAANSYGSTTGPVWQFKINPYSPTNLIITSTASTKVNLSWQLSADEPSNVDGYNIYKDGVNLADVAKGISSYQANNLACNRAYSFSVKAVRQGVESEASNAVSATTTTCAPVLVGPVGGVVLENRRPGFEWQAVDVATSYQLQVSAYANFSSPAINIAVTGTSFLAKADLLSNRLYYWRVRGRGPFGYGDWSATGTFKTANPPSLPAVSSPANNRLIVIYQPKLNWTDSVLPAGTQLDHYQVQLATDNTFSTTLYDESTAVSEFPLPAALLPDSKYYWRVQAFNTLGQFTPWTATWSFRTAVPPPSLAAPADDFVFEYRRPSLMWNEVSDATGYTLQLSKYQNFSTVLLTKTVKVSQYAFRADLPGNTLLYWRVRAEAVNGPSRWSETWKFKTGNPPGIPVLLTPASSALITYYQPRLDWANVTIPAGTQLDHYQIQIATDTSFNSIVLDRNASVSEYVPDIPLAPDTKYYWRVRSYNTVGHYSSWSLLRYFRAAMLSPVPVAPENNSSSTSLRPAFSWQSAQGATSYTVQVSRYSTFSTNLVSVVVPSTGYTSTVNLPRGVILYWRVRANGPNGPSLWSSVFRFKIQ